MFDQIYVHLQITDEEQSRFKLQKVRLDDNNVCSAQQFHIMLEGHCKFENPEPFGLSDSSMISISSSHCEKKNLLKNLDLKSSFLRANNHGSVSNHCHCIM